MATDRRRVVITGLGPVTPVGVGEQSFWHAISEGTSATRSLDVLPNSFPPKVFHSRIVATVDDELLGNEEPNEGRNLRLARLALRLALKDAGLDELPVGRTALVLGSAVGGTAAMEASFLKMDQGGKIDPDLAPRGLDR